MVTRLILRSALILSCLALALGAQISPATYAAGTPVTVGLVADISGSASAYGVSIRNGAQLAADMINKKGGINGHHLDLKIGDPNSSANQVVDLFQNFINNDHALGLIGPTLSSEAKVADPIAQQSGVPVVATSNTAPGITAVGNFIFRMSLGEADVIPSTIKIARKHFRFKKVAIIYGNDNAFSIGDGDVFKAVAQADGLNVVDTETFATGDKDFSTQLTKIKDAHPDAILCGALVQEAVLILNQARQLGIPTSVHFIGGNGFNSPALISGAGKAAEGAVEGTAWFPGGKSALNKLFVKQYRKRYKADPDQFAAQAFDGVNIMAAGIAKAKTTSNRAALRDALTKLRNVPVVTGSNGKFRFTSTRDAGEKGTVQIVKNSKFLAYK